MPRLRYGIPAATIADVARAAGCSPRTVRRYLAGLSVAGSTIQAVSAALRDRKLHTYVRRAPAPAEAP